MTFILDVMIIGSYIAAQKIFRAFDEAMEKRPRLEHDEVPGQQGFDQLAAFRKDAKGIGTGPGRVPEGGNRLPGKRGLDQAGEESQVKVMNPDKTGFGP